MAQKPPAAGGTKHYALKHVLGGAPNTPHIIPGVGYVQTDPPAPVGGPAELSLERAKKAAADAGVAVELVELTDPQAQKAREHYRAVLHDGRKALARANRDLTIPADRITDEAGAAGQEA